MDHFPSHMLYVRVWIGGKNKYVRSQSMVCLPIFSSDPQPTVERVNKKFGPSFSAYMLQLPATLQETFVNKATLEILLNAVHYVVAKLYSDDIDAAYTTSLANKANHVYTKPFLEMFQQIKVGGKIQSTVDDILRIFLDNNCLPRSSAHTLSFSIHPNHTDNPNRELFERRGQYYLQLFSHGYYSADTVAGFRVRGPISLANDKVCFADTRMVSTDADVYQCFNESLRHFLHDPQYFESSFPWLRSFLARTLETYYSQCELRLVNFVDPDMLSRAVHYLRTDPKEEDARLLAIANGVLGETTQVSEVLQANLNRMDFVPSSNTEHVIRQLHHYSRNVLHRTARKITSNKQTITGENNEPGDPVLAKALISLAENNIVRSNSVHGGGNDEQLLSANTKLHNRISHLLAESNVLEGSSLMSGSKKRSDPQALSFARHGVVQGRQVEFQSFCGDELPSTDFAASELFDAHQRPKRRKLEHAKHGECMVDEHSAGDAVVLESDNNQLPSSELMQLIKEIAASKLGRQNNPGTAIHSLEGKFSSSALVALGVVVEEITKEIFRSWYRRGHALTYNPKALLKETLAQLVGCPLTHSVSEEIIMNRLQVLFGDKAKENQQKVFQLAAFLKRGGVQLPKSDDTLGSISNFHEGSTLKELGASHKSLEFSTNSTPNYLPMYSRLPPNLCDEGETRGNLADHVKQALHNGIL